MPPIPEYLVPVALGLCLVFLIAYGIIEFIFL